MVDSWYMRKRFGSMGLQQGKERREILRGTLLRRTPPLSQLPHAGVAGCVLSLDFSGRHTSSPGMRCVLYFSYRGNASGSEQGRRLSLNSSLVLASFSIKKVKTGKPFPFLLITQEAFCGGLVIPFCEIRAFHFA